MEMNEESLKAWDIIEKTSANLFLTGKAGTGKTTFLKELKRRSPKRMVPTRERGNDQTSHQPLYFTLTACSRSAHTPNGYGLTRSFPIRPRRRRCVFRR